MTKFWKQCINSFKNIVSSTLGQLQFLAHIAMITSPWMKMFRSLFEPRYLEMNQEPSVTTVISWSFIQVARPEIKINNAIFSSTRERELFTMAKLEVIIYCSTGLFFLLILDSNAPLIFFYVYFENINFNTPFITWLIISVIFTYTSYNLI